MSQVVIGVTSKMRRSSVLACASTMVVIAATVVSIEVCSQKAPITETQLETLAESVCYDMFFFNKTALRICKMNFLDSCTTSVPAGPIAEVTSQRQSSIVVEVPRTEDYYQLVILVPRNDNTSEINYGIYEVNETTKTVYPNGQVDLQLWTLTINSEGRPGSWSMGSRVPNWNQRVIETFEVKLVTNFTLDNGNLKDPTLEATFTWNASQPKDQFDITNSCEREDQGNFFQSTIGPRSNNTLTLHGLKLDDNCSFIVRGSYGIGELNYRTPPCIEQVCRPEIPENITIFTTRVGETWDVEISWASPLNEPLKYNVTVEANNTQQAIVPGNKTHVVISDVVGEDLFEVTVVAVTTLGAAHAHRQALFQREKDSSIGVIVTGVWCLVLFIAIAAAAFIWYRIVWFRRRRRISYDKTLEFKFPKQIDSFGPEAIIAEDSWEVRPDRLLLHEVIGEGAFGVVRKGTMAPGSKEVAVKMLKDCPSVEEIRSFRAEMELMKSVGAHRHVVSLVGCCSKRRYMIVAEYCSRGDLLNYLRCAWGIMASKRNAKYYNNNIEFGSEYRNDLFKNKTPKEYSKFVVNKLYDLHGVCDAELTPVDLLSFCRQIAMGMEFLASNRVVHRDLAARNVLVTADRTLKIADFGLSRDVYQENQYKQKGTGKLPIKWMALESLTHRVYTSQSDVWSFGIVMWEVVTIGGSPYPGTSAVQLPRLLRQGYRMPRPNNCSNQLYDVMQSCWRARARDRPTFTDLYRTLDTLLNSACADDYLSLEVDGDDLPVTPKPQRYLGLIARTKRYWSNKAEIYERPLKTSQSNHYTTPPDIARVQVV